MPENKTCEWKTVKQYGGKVMCWNSECGDLSLVKSKDWNFCPFCGGKIIEAKNA